MSPNMADPLNYSIIALQITQYLQHLTSNIYFGVRSCCYFENMSILERYFKENVI